MERAHIVDRMMWEDGAGLDGPQNLALLCAWCHRRMPIIKPTDWEKGRDYALPERPSLLLAVTDLEVLDQVATLIETGDGSAA